MYRLDFERRGKEMSFCEAYKCKDCGAEFLAGNFNTEGSTEESIVKCPKCGGTNLEIEGDEEDEKEVLNNEESDCY